MTSDNADRARRLVAGVRSTVMRRSLLSFEGTVRGARGDLVIATLPVASVGGVALVDRGSDSPVRCVVVGTDRECVFLSPLDGLSGVAVGARVRLSDAQLTISLAPDEPYRMIDALGSDLLHHSSMRARGSMALVQYEPRWKWAQRRLGSIPLSGSPASVAGALREEEGSRERFVTGIRGLDALHPLAAGQRVAIVAPPGCGKSTLLLQLATQAEYDVLVMALVGERRREIREFESRLRRSGTAWRQTVVVAEPSDASPMRRMLAAQTAVSYAEWFADQGKRVVLMIDSLTRVARAMREVGLMRGEKIVRGGYTASVYSELPRLLERAGPRGRGIVTAFYSLLSHDERDVDPLKEEVISLLDGHIVLSESLARRGIYPAIHPTQSLSRIAGEVESDAQRRLRMAFLAGWERLERDRDTVLLGGRPDPELKRLLHAEPTMAAYIAQPQGARIAVHEGEAALKRVLEEMGALPVVSPSKNRREGDSERRI